MKCANINKLALPCLKLIYLDFDPCVSCRVTFLGVCPPRFRIRYLNKVFYIVTTASAAPETRDMSVTPPRSSVETDEDALRPDEDCP